MRGTGPWFSRALSKFRNGGCSARDPPDGRLQAAGGAMACDGSVHAREYVLTINAMSKSLRLGPLPRGPRQTYLVDSMD